MRNFHVRFCMNKNLTLFLHLILVLLVVLVVPANLKIMTRKDYFSIFHLVYISDILITVYNYSLA